MSAIDCQSVSVSLGGVPRLKDVTFAIDEGWTVGLLGANGSGKSTLVKTILGLIPPQQGTVTLFGQERFTAWGQLGYVPQRAGVSLHSTTVSEIVASGTLAGRPVGWFGAKRRAAVAAALDAVGLADQAGELYLHLSGGQQQRVLIARALVNRPRLLILDEPFAGVDLANQAEIAATLRRSAATVLVVLHETEALADQLDRVLILSGGRLTYDGPPVDLPGVGTHETKPPNRTHLLTGMEPRWTS